MCTVDILYFPAVLGKILAVSSGEYAVERGGFNAHI
jgi:hypothetical protein